MLAVFYATDTFGEITIITDERTDTTGCNTLSADAFGRKGGGDVVAVRSYTYSDALALFFVTVNAERFQQDVASPVETTVTAPST